MQFNFIILYYSLGDRDVLLRDPDVLLRDRD